VNLLVTTLSEHKSNKCKNPRGGGRLNPITSNFKKSFILLLSYYCNLDRPKAKLAFFRKAHCILAAEFSTVYHVVAQVLKHKRHSLK